MSQTEALREEISWMRTAIANKDAEIERLKTALRPLAKVKAESSIGSESLVAAVACELSNSRHDSEEFAASTIIALVVDECVKIAVSFDNNGLIDRVDRFRWTAIAAALRALAPTPEKVREGGTE